MAKHEEPEDPSRTKLSLANLRFFRSYRKDSDSNCDTLHGDTMMCHPLHFRWQLYH